MRKDNIVGKMEGLHSTSGRPEHHRPYGEAPALLGLRAADLLYDLCDVPAWTEGQRWRWVQSDRLALIGWQNLEAETLDALAEPGLNRSQVGDILGLLSDFHVAVPFDEAEGTWLLNVCGEALEKGENLSFVRNRRPEEIVSAGLRRVIDGRDLLRRWWAWRRDTDEFRGQGTVDMCREALRVLIETLSPDLNLPEGIER
ncbi:MAG TPA: hypothetical protein VK712_03280 [Verrucomicrobiae bacterium]|jgi:hypothetical protein|nr:hypothetical protein [Verrucomicrobiae bacterium]